MKNQDKDQITEEEIEDTTIMDMDEEEDMDEIEAAMESEETVRDWMNSLRGKITQ